MNDWDSEVRRKCRAERRFQDKKLKDLKWVHLLLEDEDMTEQEKYAALVIEGWGKQRASQLVWGDVRGYRK